AKYREIEKNEVRYDSFMTDDCQWLLVAYGSSARICHKVVEMARKDGLKVGLLRPVTLFPFPYEPISAVASHCKGIMSVELNAGQMVEDVKLAVNGQTPVCHFGRMGGAIHSPEEVYAAFKEQFSL
ncbi:MAG: 3-methyl-2-oxobutanoate dehydrogenase subunit beta, partial [Rikenellaceae bacterium]|nr:3-methyl-2-oxobutanoate dehydrogenase subunit beta [Rikenellaceae bacterium]